MSVLGNWHRVLFVGRRVDSSDDVRNVRIFIWRFGIHNERCCCLNLDDLTLVEDLVLMVKDHIWL